jgi:uncharacterized membrane protein
MEQKNQSRATISVERLNAFSDAVFAVAITLLVLNIDVPMIARNLARTQLPGILIDMVPRFWAFVFSFILIGIFWMAHHSTFHLIKKHSEMLSWLNLIFLLTIVALPFSTDLESIYDYLQFPTIIYALNLGAAGLMMSIIWWYASKNHKLIDKSLSSGLIRHIQLKSLTIPFAALIVIVVSFINVSIASWFWLLILIIHLYLEVTNRHKYKGERGYKYF